MAQKRRHRVCYIRRMTQHKYRPGALSGTPGVTGVTGNSA